MAIADYPYSFNAFVVHQPVTMAPHVGVVTLRDVPGGAALLVADLAGNAVAELTSNEWGIVGPHRTTVAMPYVDAGGTYLLREVALELLAGTYTDEQARDAIAAALAAGTHTNITVVSDDTADSISISLGAQMLATINAKAARALTKTSVAASYTLVAGDAVDKVLHTTASAALTITLPADTVVIAQEVAIPWRQYAAGQVTFVAGAGATVLGRGGALKSAGQYAEGVLTKVAANTWLVTGDVVA